MKTPPLLENTIFYLLKRMNLYPIYTLIRGGPLKEDGWFRAMKDESSVDSNGNPIPWFTYPSIEFLQKRITSDMSVFEYGCGNSTIWWANRVREVISVEHDKEWHEKVRHRLHDYATIHRIELEYGGDYSKKISDYENIFDIVVIDGRDRVNCVKNSLKALKPDGIIILDNSDRIEYQDGHHFLFEKGFRKIEFVGLAPAINYKSETGIFYRPSNCFSI
jgi:SAM-dependent methyltransferase